MLLKTNFVSHLLAKISGKLVVAELGDHYQRMVRYEKRMDATVPAGAAVFIGDSLIQSVATDAITCPSANYGIGGDTTVGVLARLSNYGALSRASVIVLAVGVNDLRFRDNEAIAANYQRILELLPRDVPVICSSVLPIDEAAFRGPSAVTNQRIVDLNNRLERLCNSGPHRSFVDAGKGLADDSGHLRLQFHEGDGLHLNGAGYQIWIAAMRQEIDKLRPTLRATIRSGFSTEAVSVATQ
jgi:lysophospholipase L1-like esterase